MLRFAGIRNIGSITEASTEVPALRAEAPLLPALGRRGIFLSDGTLAYTNDCRVTANISRMLAAGPGSRSARAPPEARASGPKSNWRLRLIWNENAVRAFAIIIARRQRLAANSKESCHEQYHLAGRGRRYRNCDTQLPWASLGFAFSDAYAEQVVIWVVSGSLRFAGAATIGANETTPLFHRRSSLPDPYSLRPSAHGDERRQPAWQAAGYGCCRTRSRLAGCGAD